MPRYGADLDATSWGPEKETRSDFQLPLMHAMKVMASTRAI